MKLSTKEKNTTQPKSSDVYDKKERIAELKVYHTKLFKQEGVENPLFIPKLAYIPTGKSEKHLAFFLSEMQQKADTYTEFVGSTYISEDPERRLWKLEHNPHFEDEYDKTEPHPISGHRRYLVPVGELIEIKQEGVEQLFSILEDIDTNTKDAPMGTMTIRDYMAIHMRTPCSTKAFINEIINNENKKVE